MTLSPDESRELAAELKYPLDPAIRDQVEEAAKEDGFAAALRILNDSPHRARVKVMCETGDSIAAEKLLRQG